MQDEYKEFTGKNLDEAMSAACDFFGVERGKLEVEIINDAKTGIFGLVGAKKATVRARRAQLENLGLSMGDEKKNARQAQQRKGRDTAKQEKRPEKQAREALNPASEESAATAPEKAEKTEKKNGRGQKPQKGNGRAQAEPATEETEENARGQRNSRQNGKKQNTRRQRDAKPKNGNRPAPAAQPADYDNAADQNLDLADKLPEIPLESMDQELLGNTVLEAVNMLILHIVGETEKDVEISNNKVRVSVHSGEDSGLLIGRDGQTLSALQYLVSCIASRKMGASVRVQIDAGDYRERQMEKLAELALELAQKVKENGRPQSTRPLSAFQRRAIHMALQDDPDVQTHSKGEGGLKRVIIVPKRK